MDSIFMDSVVKDASWGLRWRTFGQPTNHSWRLPHYDHRTPLAYTSSLPPPRADASHFAGQRVRPGDPRPGDPRPGDPATRGPVHGTAKGALRPQPSPFEIVWTRRGEDIQNSAIRKRFSRMRNMGSNEGNAAGAVDSLLVSDLQSVLAGDQERDLFLRMMMMRKQGPLRQLPQYVASVSGMNTLVDAAALFVARGACQIDKDVMTCYLRPVRKIDPR